MDDDKKDVVKTVFFDHLGGVLIALAVAFGATWAMRFLGVDEGVTSGVNLFLFFTFVFADPVGAWRGSQTWSKFWIKLGAGAVVAVTLAMIFLLVDFGGPTEGASNEDGGAEAASGGFAWAMVLLFLIIPIVFMGPLLERILSGQGPTGEKLEAEDLQIGLTFPLYISGHFLMIGAVAGALWIIDLPWSAGLLALTAGVLCAVTEAWLARPEDQLPDWEEDGSWQPRAESAQAAWSGLGKAFRASFASALFMGGMTFATVSLAISMNSGGEGSLDEGLGILMDLAVIGGLVLAASLGLLLYGVVLVASLAYVVGRLHGIDPLALEHFVKQSFGRLFMGGMSYVRPDLDEDT